MPVLGFNRAEKRDSSMRAIIRDMCGAAFANTKIFPAKLIAGLAIAICGDLFHDQDEQRQLLAILDKAENHLGWPCLKVAPRMRRH